MTGNNSTPFLDLVLNLLLVFVFFFVVAINMANVKKKQEEAIKKPKAEYLITVTWQKNSKDDVDTWLQDPNGNVMFFRNRNVGLMHLDRDDRGMVDDTTYVNGELVKFPFNQEITTIRGIIPGIWVLNVHLYRKRDNCVRKVFVRIDKLNPTVKIVYTAEIILKENWEEKTVLEFELDKDGNIIDKAYEQVNLVSVENPQAMFEHWSEQGGR